jgi:hypothetical protein
MDLQHNHSSKYKLDYDLQPCKVHFDRKFQHMDQNIYLFCMPYHENSQNLPCTQGDNLGGNQSSLLDMNKQRECQEYDKYCRVHIRMGHKD